MMNKARSFTVAGLLLASLLGTGAARADDMLGSYVARISDRDHHASDGYELDSAAQMVRQDPPTGTSFTGATPMIRVTTGSAAMTTARICSACCSAAAR